jgi:uncharacterized membrane-anchored protein
MKLAAAPIWLYVYALPAPLFLLAALDMREKKGRKTRFVKTTFIAAIASFIWLYTGCFTQLFIGPAYSTLREIVLVVNFFGVLIVAVLWFFAKSRMQLWTAIACVVTAFFWLITIAANAVA